MHRSPYIVIALLLVLSSAAAQEKREVSYSRDLFPIVKARCIKCHERDDENPSNYAMESVDLVKRSGKTANMVVPGNADGSYLIVKLLPNPPKGAQMPIFSKKKMTPDEVNLFRAWIDQGARDN
ncbi:MAG: hypothetical protein F9K22_06110 [Bacteroidetes bacterium]|nr:MAG: hypothetical protein F9K22_06110 [Bacteroidota bacterium]